MSQWKSSFLRDIYYSIHLRIFKQQYVFANDFAPKTKCQVMMLQNKFYFCFSVNIQKTLSKQQFTVSSTVSLAFHLQHIEKVEQQRCLLFETATPLTV